MFKFKGISSKEMDVYVTEIDNLIRKAPQRYEEIYIDGRDGAFFHPLGYSPIEVPLELTLMKPERVDEVLQWLNGTGWLEYNGRKTKAHIFSEVEPIRASTVRIIQVTIIRNPFWERVEDDWEEAWGANLIKNGWDDFGAYGSGKNYVENWNFESDDLSEFLGGNAMVLSRVGDTLVGEVGPKGVASHSAILISNISDMPQGEYVVRVKLRSTSSSTRINYRTRNATEDRKQQAFDISGTEVIEFHFNRTVLEDFDIYIYARGTPKNIQVGDKIEIDWIQITPIDNQHLVVEKTPLGNGLTRIQTFGGNKIIKLVANVRSDVSVGDKQTRSLWIKNLGKGIVRFDQDGNTFEGDPKARWGENQVGHKFFTGTFRKDRINSNSFIRSDNNLPLDFIASDPVIVEGDRVPSWQATSDPAIYNEGTTVAKPLIKLEKGKDRQCEFEVNGTYFKFHFNDDDHVILDCEEMEATYNGFNRNRHLTIGFEWPKLKPKENFVKRISGDAKILFKRKDRWL